MLKKGKPLRKHQAELRALASARVHIMLFMENIYQAQAFPLLAMLRTISFDNLSDHGSRDRQQLQATDPRDKVLALLGLVNDKEELSALGVVPDYTKSKENLYTTATAAMLTQGHVSLLSICCGIARPGGLPSWVPDWSKPVPETLQCVEGDHITLHPRFNACGTKERFRLKVLKTNQGVQKIFILVNICDSIIHSENIRRIPFLLNATFPLDWVSATLRLSKFGNAPRSDYTERLQTAARVSHAGMRFREDGILERVYQFPETVRRLKDMDSATRGMNSNSEHAELARISQGRSPFITGKGHLGIGSITVQKGDIVALISGAQTPFILRRKSDSEQYMIVSEAYVDGIMDGEAAEDGRWSYIELM
jgi:hypothetical protein